VVPERSDLLQRFRDGDQDAFHEIVVRYQVSLIRFFVRLCWDRAQAEDLTQEVFLRVLRGSATYVTKGRLSNYLLRIATNLWIDTYRARQNVRQVHSLNLVASDPAAQAEIAALVASGPGPELAACDVEQTERLKAALATLGEHHRLVFDLAAFQGLPYERIAKVLGIPVGTVKSRMHSAVRSLRKILVVEEDESASGTSAVLA
jgi:RNA polymerase sigma-70 factor (ECF subfamily)